VERALLSAAVDLDFAFDLDRLTPLLDTKESNRHRSGEAIREA
jgi:hypothetical protein